MTSGKNNEEQVLDLLQLAHGKILPSYSSAYSLRCTRYISGIQNRILMSVGGLVFRDRVENQNEQYHSLFLSAISFFKSGRMFEINLSNGRYLRRKYSRLVSRRIKQTEIVIFEGPWQFKLFKEHLDGKIVVYDAHNVETNLRKTDAWEEFTRKLEGELIERADLIITVTEEDSNEFSRIFGVSEDKLLCVPEGFVPTDKKWRGFDTNNLVFIGSAYLPNIRAAERILDYAPSLPEFSFEIIGSVCDALKRKQIPKNVKLLGLVSEEEKEDVLRNALFGINPVEIGSGRNLKMNDYISHGVPILTTEVGSRGFEPEIKELFYIFSAENFPEVIRSLIIDRTNLYEISNKMIEYSKENSYEQTKEKAFKAIENLLSVHRQRKAAKREE